MAAMGLISTAPNKMPTWAHVLLTALAVTDSILHYGFWSFLLHVISSPSL
jgi:hypothetical protein